MFTEAPRVHEKDFIVGDREAIHFLGADVPPALSTPSLVNWIEMTCREHAAPLLGPGEDTVGVSVEIKHLAATPVGMKVRVVTTLRSQEGRFFKFEAEAFDEADKIGEATHTRASVLVGKFAERLAAKKEKAGLGR